VGFLSRLRTSLTASLTDAPSTPLREIWRTELRGRDAYPVHYDQSSGSVWAGDGAISFASLSVHRFDAATGRKTASVRTRHQPARAMVVHEGSLWVSTDRRLFRLDPIDLSVQEQWDERLVGFADTLVPMADGRLAMANSVTASVGVFDPRTGRTRRVTVGGQPVVARAGDDIVVAKASAGGVQLLDPASCKLRDAQDSGPVTAMVSCGPLWVVPAGSRSMVALDDPQRPASLEGRVSGLSADLARGRVWALLEGGRIQGVDLATRSSGEVYRVAAGDHVTRVAPELGLVLARRPQQASDDDLIAYGIPD
jgi:DNA-binding beta-propeller fold protein YncE